MGSFPRFLPAIGLAMLAALPAHATTAIVVPEPESLSLLAAFVAIGVIALRFLRRR